MFLKVRKILSENFLFIIILTLALIVRLYRLSELSTFGGDQGIDFISVREMIVNNKWTLIGIKTSIAPFFQGPLYLYTLYPFFYFMNLNPISGAVAAVTMSTMSLLFFYIMVTKYFPKNVALASSALFATSPELVIYGNTPLYQNFLPIFVIAALFLLLSKSKVFSKYLFLGLVLGLGMEMHFLNVSLVVAVFIMYVFWEKIGLKKLLGYIFGIFIGLLPTIAFEFRHDFLNTRLLLNYVSNGERIGVSVSHFLNQWILGSARFLAGNNSILGLLVLLFSILYLFSKKRESLNTKRFNNLALILFFVLNLIGFIFSAFGPEYPLPFWIMMLIIIPVGVFKKFSKKIGFILILLLLFSNTATSITRLKSRSGYNMPEGLTLNKIKIAGKIIKSDAVDHQNFNIASVLDGGTRAHPLRYSVLINGEKPQSEVDYPNNNYLYLLARPNSESVLESRVWELQVFKPFKIGKEWDLDDNIYLYRLDRLFEKLN